MKKILRAIIVRLQDSASNIHKFLSFLNKSSGRHGLKDYLRVMESPAIPWCQRFFSRWGRQN